MGVLTKVATAASLLYFGSRIAKDYTEKVWDRVSFSVPPKSVKVGLEGTKLKVSSSLKVDNSNNTTIRVKNLTAIIKYNDNQGQLVEVGRTLPSGKTWTIAARQSTIITDIAVQAGILTSIKAIKNALTLPEGERLMVSYSASVNGFPVSYDYWY